MIFYSKTIRDPVALNTLRLNTMGTEIRIKRGRLLLKISTEFMIVDLLTKDLASKLLNDHASMCVISSFDALG